MMKSVVLFTVGLVLLWIGSGLAVQAVIKISRKLQVKSFFVSFFILGFFTSITEILVGVNALLIHEPEIFIGNLIGSSVVVFLFVVSLLAILGNGVNLNHTFPFRDLVTAALVVGVPALLTMDNSYSYIDAIVSISLYGYFIYTLERHSKSLEKLPLLRNAWTMIAAQTMKIIFAIVFVFTGSRLLVSETIVLGNAFNISPYIISILVLSLGTNIPELSIAIRSVLAKNKDIAFGDYVGSASLNTLEMGVLSLITGKSIVADGSNYSVLAFIVGLVLFTVFGKSGNTISRKEGILLLTCYLVFMACELFTGPGWTWYDAK